MAANFLGMKDEIEQDEDDILDYSFRRVKVDDDMVKKIQDIQNDEAQLSSITRNKREYFRMYSFKISAVSSERKLIDVINSGAEAALLGPGQTVTNNYDIEIGVTMVLLDNIMDKRKMNTVDAYRLHQDAHRKIIKSTIQRGLNTINYGNINILLNPNFIREAGVFIHNVPQ